MPELLDSNQGEWVTSRFRDPKNTEKRYYYRKSDHYWRELSYAQQAWFRTEEELLAEYPGRVRHDKAAYRRERQHKLGLT